MICRVCGITLDDNNWSPSRIKKKDYICKECHQTYSYQWICKHKAQKRLSDKIYYTSHKKIHDKICKDYYQTHKERWINLRKTDKHKEGIRKSLAKRRREFNYIPLNKPFKDSEGHHIDKYYVLYIPKKLHREIYHNMYTGYNMDLINDLAFEWYMYKTIKR